MAASAPQIFTNISPDQYALLTQKANAAGMGISGNRGTASQFGVELAWNYSPDTQELSLQCLRAPFFMAAEQVNSKIRDLVHKTIS